MKAVLEIDMPESCRECKLSDYWLVRYCKAVDNWDDEKEEYLDNTCPEWEGRRPDCPLIPIDYYLYKHGITDPRD